MTRILAISLVIAIVFGSWGWFLANSRAGTIKDGDAQENYEEREVADDDSDIMA